MATMQLTDHDLKQINQEYLASLSPGHLLQLSSKLLDDLRDARDRLNQTPQNSSRPSGRKISHGTRTSQGSRAFALLASVPA